MWRSIQCRRGNESGTSASSQKTWSGIGRSRWVASSSLPETSLPPPAPGGLRSIYCPQIAAAKAGVANAIVDINPPLTRPDSRIQFFRVNISRENDWKVVEDHVAKHGKFSFSICSHTLEDVANPLLVCEKLSIISESGYVAVPSKFVEMARFEKVMATGISYRGYIHHRWVFTIRDGLLWGFPKVPFVEIDPFFDQIGNHATNSNLDMSFFWDSRLNLQIVNDDYLGPSVDAVIGYYHDLMIRDDVDSVAGTTYP